MSALQDEINKLKTLQESFDELSSKVLDTQAVLSELNYGKKLIAAAITEKGVETSPTDSMMQMAENVGSIIAVEGFVYPTQSMQDSIVAMEDVNRTQTTWFFKNNNTISFQNLKRIKAIANIHDATFNIYTVKYEMPNLEQIEEYSTITDAALLPLGGDFIFPKLRHIDTASRYALIITSRGSVGDFIIDLPSLEGGVGNVLIMNCGNHSSGALNVLCKKVRIGAATVGAGIQVYYDPFKNSPLLFLTDVEVMEGFAVNLNLEWCIALTRENIVNHIFNRIATLKAEVTKTISIPATPFALLTDEDIAIATNKGWTIKSI